MQLIRTIHPVGQGAFYSERFIDDLRNQLALVVYDCGSLNPNILKREVSSYFNQIKEIDILFISHFDSDHVNGIQMMLSAGVHIKTVVVPLLSASQKWFYVYLLGENSLAVTNPLAFFNADRVIEIEPVNIQGFQGFNSNPNQETIMVDSLGNGSYNRPSNTPIGLSKLPFWLYRPFNFDEAKRINLLKNALREMKIDIPSLQCPSFINTMRSTINNAYKKICNDGSNCTSLIVYSGPNYNGRIFMSIWQSPKFHIRVFPFRSASPIPSGCLYFGDTDLNQYSSSGRDILTVLDQFPENIKEQIGSIQLPHHGSGRNYNNLLSSLFNKTELFFASFNSSNIFGHPSAYIVEDLFAQRRLFLGVTEKRDSLLLEIIEFKK